MVCEWNIFIIIIIIVIQVGRMPAQNNTQLVYSKVNNEKTKKRNLLMLYMYMYIFMLFILQLKMFIDQTSVWVCPLKKKLYGGSPRMRSFSALVNGCWHINTHPPLPITHLHSPPLTNTPPTHHSSAISPTHLHSSYPSPICTLHPSPTVHS